MTIKSSCYFVFSHSVLLCPSLYSTNLHNSLTAPNYTALVPIRLSTANRLLISLYYSTLKVFKSYVKSSQADFFFNYELPAAISYRQLTETLDYDDSFLQLNLHFDRRKHSRSIASLVWSGLVQAFLI
jgi:hypothetical protein